MTQVAGFQQSGLTQVIGGYPGDLVGGRTVATLGAKGYQAFNNPSSARTTWCEAGQGVFLLSDGYRVAGNTTDGSTNLAGIAVRNVNTMDWTDSYQGFSIIIPDGKLVEAFIFGDIIVQATGVNASGTADHIPARNDLVWVVNANGSIVTAPSSVTVANATSTKLTVSQTGLYSNPALGANLGLVVVSGSVF